MAAVPDRRSISFTAESVPENYSRLLAPVVFEPWAEVLLAAVPVAAGDAVLDVASGTGVVARLAARHAGPGGRVVASDISPAMLATSRAQPAPDGAGGWAPIEYVEASALELPFPDASFDVVLCQQGLQFFPDRAAATREIHRVLRPGGTVGIEAWAAGVRLEPFADYGEALDAIGVEPPFPGAFDPSTFALGPDSLRDLLSAGGLTQITISTTELEIEFPDAAAAATAILGTPFGPLVGALSPERRAALETDLARRFSADTGGPFRRTTTSLVARAGGTAHG